MPTKTFFHLSEEKRKLILGAAIREFSSVPFEKASINQIIKDAGISRGSFYMYFDDIYDLALFLMQKFKQDVFIEMQKRYSEIPNQLDDLLKNYHEVIYDFYNEDIYRSLFRNMISYLQGRPEEELMSLKNRMPLEKSFDRLIPFLDKQQFKDTSKDYILFVIDMSLVMFRNIMFKTFVQNLNKRESQALLKKSLDTLKFGYGGEKNA